MHRTAIVVVAHLSLAGLACAQGVGVTVPPGFRAEVFAEGLPAWLRHIDVAPNGDVYCAIWRGRDSAGGVVALRDEDGDGRADRVERFGAVRGSGLDIRDGWLYYGENNRVLRWRLDGESLVPTGEPEVIVAQIEPSRGGHEAKTITFDGAGRMFVNVGAPSNACQEQARTPGSPGMDPCPHLEWHAGIWVFDADAPSQRQRVEGRRFATGLRNCVALEWNPVAGDLYAVMHGRDQLDSLFPDRFTAEQRAELPGEEFHRLGEGANAGWPYTYWDPMRAERMVGPEYGGDGRTPSRDERFQDPVQSFPAHWAPNDLLFYDGEMFPARYRGGAFVAHHGSWNRAPAPQAGYAVTFTPFENGLPSGDFEEFAGGFAGAEEIRSPGEAAHRPTGLAIGPDGALYISDSKGGTIWRVVYVGE